jgi:hypothetical protein
METDGRHSTKQEGLKMHRAGSWPALLAFPRHLSAQVTAANYFFFAAFFLVAFLAFFLAAML